MSIAVSAVIKPSRILHNTLICLCVGSIVIVYLVLLSQVKDFGLLPRIAVGAVWVVSLPFIFHFLRRRQKAVRIDISGLGQIRLAPVDQPDTAVTAASKTCTGELHRLLPDSTLWAQLILLRLKNEDGKIKVLIVLPDSLEGDGFRVLSVACRWIAAHNNPDERKIV